jgi:hypothetical protein
LSQVRLEKASVQVWYLSESTHHTKASASDCRCQHKPLYTSSFYQAPNGAHCPDIRICLPRGLYPGWRWGHAQYAVGIPVELAWLVLAKMVSRRSVLWVEYSHEVYIISRFADVTAWSDESCVWPEMVCYQWSSKSWTHTQKRWCYEKGPGNELDKDEFRYENPPPLIIQQLCQSFVDICMLLMFVWCATSFDLWSYSFFLTLFLMLFLVLF